MDIPIKYYKYALEQLPCTLISDSQGRYLYVNDGWVRHMGHSREEIIGKRIKDIVPNTKVDEVLRTGEAFFSGSINDKNGQQLFNHYFPIKEHGSIIGVCVFTFFTGIDEAISFTKQLNELNIQLNYYKNELKKLQGARHKIDEIIGSSKSISTLKNQIRAAANTTSTVLIQGETGTGKELIANAIHDLSSRSLNPFIKVNCSAIPGNLVESELFGYTSGAFTGASRQGHIGLFETASKGSLFLDEINQMEYFVQPKLLRVLQEKEITRVGGTKSIPIDVRVIAATNQALSDLVETNRFREDLYYRLNVFTIKAPPLRDHIEDIPELLEAIITRLNRELGLSISGFEEDVVHRLMKYHWPGNIRELNNVVERAMNYQMSGILSWDQFTEYFDVKKKVSLMNSYSLKADTSIEKRIIEDCLNKNKYNKTKTAKALGISRTLLYTKMRQLNISK